MTSASTAAERQPPRAAVVVLAGGSGTRVGGRSNKVLLPIAGVAVLARAVRTPLEVAGVERLVLVVRPEDRDDVEAAVAPVLGERDVWLVDGGAERHDSEWAALQVLAPEVGAGVDVIAIHDGARPLASAQLFREVLDTAHRTGAAVPVVAAGPFSHRDGRPEARRLAAVQTPQAFAAGPLLEAYRQAATDGFRGTDTAACWERYVGTPIATVPGSPRNLKVTFVEDLPLAEELVSPRG